MSTLASRDHVYAIVLGLVAGYASWSRNPWLPTPCARKPAPWLA